MNQEPNPFASPEDDGTSLPKYVPSSDPSIEHEPNRLEEEFSPEELEELHATAPRMSDDVEVEHSVWDEPGLSTNLTGAAPSHAITYDRWLKKKVSETPIGLTWLVTWCAGLLSGLLALPGTLFLGYQFGNSIVSHCLIEPLAEEVVKIALAIWIVEKRPYLFKYASQIVVACACSGMVFSLIEFLVLRQFPSRNAQGLILNGQWLLALGLHISFSSLAGFGLVRVWRHAIATASRSQLSRGGAFIVAAVAIHAALKSALVVASSR